MELSAEAVAARDAEINGRPPRIAPLAPDEIGEEAFAVLTEMRAAIGAPPTRQMPEFSATFLRHPHLCQAHTGLAMFLFQGALSPRDRELAILRTGWLCQAPFEWSAHTRVAKRVGAIDEAEIERVTQGSTAPGWSDHERAVLRAVEELFERAMISDETWAVLARTFDEKQLMELPILVAQYQGVAYLQNSLRVRLMPGSAGLTAR
jgi:alkylhydroperoxidase family enzyme